MDPNSALFLSLVNTIPKDMIRLVLAWLKELREDFTVYELVRYSPLNNIKFSFGGLDYITSASTYFTHSIALGFSNKILVLIRPHGTPKLIPRTEESDEEELYSTMFLLESSAWFSKYREMGIRVYYVMYDTDTDEIITNLKHFHADMWYTFAKDNFRINLALRRVGLRSPASISDVESDLDEYLFEDNEADLIPTGYHSEEDDSDDESYFTPDEYRSEDDSDLGVRN